MRVFRVFILQSLYIIFQVTTKSSHPQLAKKNLNLVLVSRNPEKLETVSKEITEKYQVEVKVIAVDFKSGLQIYDTISKGIEGLEVGVLVNNIGISYSHPEYYLESVKQDEAFLQDIISCNINSVTYMTKLVLPAMVERKKGLIINISSMAAIIPNPLLSVYSSTKVSLMKSVNASKTFQFQAFVDKFTEDLNTEYKDQGILIQSVLPGFVCSNMSKIKRPSLLTPSADTYVNSALNTLGYSRHTTGYLPHAFMALILCTMASINLDFANNFVLKELLNTRNKALKREKKN